MSYAVVRHHLKNRQYQTEMKTLIGTLHMAGFDSTGVEVKHETWMAKIVPTRVTYKILMLEPAVVAVGHDTDDNANESCSGTGMAQNQPREEEVVPWPQNLLAETPQPMRRDQNFALAIWVAVLGSCKLLWKGLAWTVLWVRDRLM